MAAAVVGVVGLSAILVGALAAMVVEGVVMAVAGAMAVAMVPCTRALSCQG